MMAEVLAILTPQVLTLIAYVAGAGVLGMMIIAAVLYVSDLDIFGWLS
jgi:hypothetical protein